MLLAAGCWLLVLLLAMAMAMATAMAMAMAIIQVFYPGGCSRN